MDWIFLAPHLDDVAYSCGGLVWELTRNEHPVSIWTICAGIPEPDSLSPFAEQFHQRWKTGQDSVRKRIEEDRIACDLLGARPRYFSIPDCIYRFETGMDRIDRFHYYQSEDQIFGDLHPSEYKLADDLAKKLLAHAPADAKIVCPLTIGGHVDHQLVRKAAETAGLPLMYYAEFPYIRDNWTAADQVRSSNWKVRTTKISPEGMRIWQSAAAIYQSQISTFWKSEEDLFSQLREFERRMGGIRIFEQNSRS